MRDNEKTMTDGWDLVHDFIAPVIPSNDNAGVFTYISDFKD